MISRRGLLGGLSLLPLAGGVSGCAARAAALAQAQAQAQAQATADAASTSVTIPVVGPGSRWNGTALSGGTPPTDPTRTTAKPAVQWWQPSELRMSGDMVIGVDADAKGGVAHVDFWVEGTVQRTTQSLYLDTDANGNTRQRLGFWIKLNSSAFKIISTTGGARIFATAYPNDGSMQPRTIGNAPVGTPSSSYNGDRQLIVYPRATANDYACTVGPAAVDARPNFTTLDAAIVAIKAAKPEAADVEITATNTYELSTVTGSRYVGAKGFHTIRASSGKTATIGRAVFPTGDASTWSIDPLIECLEFRGAGVVVDFRNFSTVGNGAYQRGHRFNGCVVTNSIGTRDSLYWNRGPGPNRGNPAPGYVEDCSISYVQGFTIFQYMATGNKTRSVTGHIWSGTHFAANSTVYDINAGFFRTATPAMTMAYNGTGTATLTKNGGNDSGSLILNVNGSAVKTYPLGSTPGAAWYNLSDIVADINANAPGWSATLLDTGNSRRASALIGHGFGSTQSFTNQPVTSAGVQVDTYFDQHCDIVQFFTAGGLRENFLHRGTTAWGIGVGAYADPGVKPMLLDSSLNDVVMTDVIFGGPNTSSQIGAPPSIYSHVYIRNMTHEGGITLQPGQTPGNYSGLEQCIMGQIGWSTGTPTPVFFKDCYIAYGFQGPAAFTASPNGGGSDPGGGNTLFNASTATDFHLSTLCVDPANGDYRPRPAMPVKAAVSSYDGGGVRRAANDAIGAVALSAPKVNWQF